MIPKKKEDLYELADALQIESMKFELEITNSKTKLMKIRGEGHFSEVIEEVDNFRFLGSQVTTSGDSSTEITNRIATAKSTTNSLGSLWKSNKGSIDTKVNP